MNPTAIQQALTSLVGLPLYSISRVSNMLILYFGKMREVATRRGGKVMIGEWALHIQCAWRLCRLGRIVVAYRDYYYDPDGDSLKDWETSGKSRFDQVAAALCIEFGAAAPFVLTVTTDDVGGFSLALNYDLRLDVFPDDSNCDEYAEHWRLFQPRTGNDHFVVP
jgi:hypothetical protein